MNGLIFAAKITDINRSGLGFSGEKREQKKGWKKVEKREKSWSKAQQSQGEKISLDQASKQDYSLISCTKLVNKYNKDVF